MGKRNKLNQPRFLILQVIPKINKDNHGIEKDIEETKQLITTFGGEIVETIIQKKDHPDPNFYIGAGKVDEIIRFCKDEEIDVVILNDLVKSSQIFRIEKELWSINANIMVWDRIDLILNIFDQHASTVEAKLQIKLARATHMGPRIYGLGKTELSRQGGGVGTRGKGETNIEFERRQIKIDQQKIKKELKKLLKQKHSRLRKRNEMGIGPVALVGYTSAGKTTLFNALTGKEKEMNKGLFTTLDTVVGKMKLIDFTRPILVSDTIGFINNLPPVLIDSFKSTLLESLEAKLLLHVVDASDPEIMKKIRVVEEILDSLEANQPRNIVLNKIDLTSADKLEKIENDINNYFKENNKEDKLRSIQRVSAQTGKNLEILKNNISRFFKPNKK